VAMKKMTKKEELNEELTQVWLILVAAKESYQYCYYMHKPKSDSELKYINDSKDFKYIRHLLWRVTIIELAKIFRESKETDRFNIFHLLNKLKSLGYFKSLKFPNQKILEFESTLKQDNLINQIIDLRDKIYAHTDSNTDKLETNLITFEALENLIHKTERIINEIFETVLNTTIQFDSPVFNRERFDAFEILAKDRESFLEQQQQQLNEFLKK
jgi:hypothetical protein